MPELPEVETVRRTLQPVIGYRVKDVWGSGRPLHMNKEVDLAGLRSAALGRTIRAVGRHGKYLLLEFSRSRTPTVDTILVHLGMTGRLRVFPKTAPVAEHTHVIWRLTRGLELRYSDARRFGQVAAFRRGGEPSHPALEKLGVDPLTSPPTGSGIFDLAQKARKSMKAFLMDQRSIAGLGNIYVSEVLWSARLSPTAPANELSSASAQRLARAIRDVLTRALTHGGTTLRDFVAADGATGTHSDYLRVYGREGQRCLRRGCRSVIERVVLHGRATFSCPSCQSI